MRRALAIDEKTFGPEHPRVATDVTNLTELLQATKRLAEAEPIMRRALAIDEKTLGPDHPKVAIRLSQLAGLLLATKRLAEVEPIARRMVGISLDFFRRSGQEQCMDRADELLARRLRFIHFTTHARDEMHET
jgi:Tetratricopeptide repeat